MPEVPIDRDDCDEIELKLEIVVDESNYKSRAVTIWYQKEKKGDVPRKAARRHEAQSHTDEVSTSLAATNSCDMHPHTTIEAGISDMWLEQPILDNTDSRQENDNDWIDWLADLPDFSHEDTINPITVDITLPDGLYISKDRVLVAETETFAVPSSATVRPKATRDVPKRIYEHILDILREDKASCTQGVCKQRKLFSTISVFSIISSIFILFRWQHCVP